MRRSSLPSLAALSLNHCGPVVPTSVKRRCVDDSEDEGESPRSPTSPANKKVKARDLDENEDLPDRSDPDAEWLQAAESDPKYKKLEGWGNVMNNELEELLAELREVCLGDGINQELDTFREMQDRVNALEVENRGAHNRGLADFFEDLGIVMKQLEIDYRGARRAGMDENNLQAQVAVMHFKENLKEWCRLNKVPMQCSTRTVASCRAVLDILVAHPVLAACCYSQFDDDDPDGLKAAGYEELHARRGRP